MPIIDLIKDIVDGKKEAKCLIDLLTSDRVFKQISNDIYFLGKSLKIFNNYMKGIQL